MPEFMKKRKPLLRHIGDGCANDTSHILIDQTAAFRAHQIVGASLFVLAENKRSVLELIAEGKLHLVPVLVR